MLDERVQDDLEMPFDLWLLTHWHYGFMPAYARTAVAGLCSSVHDMLMQLTEVGIVHDRGHFPPCQMPR